MADALSPEAFYESAREFAVTALQAHHAGEYRRLPLNAGTALEHLVKACLAKRSPALLCELRGEASYPDLLRLLGIGGGGRVLRPARTVGLRSALERVKVFVTSGATDRDLRTLVDMRDGTVHAALNDEVEERLVVAFVQHADALLKDLGRDRAQFWGEQLAVVDALLVQAGDKVAHDVAVKLASARAYFSRQYSNEPAELADLVRRLAAPSEYGDNQEPTRCPGCGSLGLATGSHRAEWEPDEWEGDEPVHLIGWVHFMPSAYECRVCKLRLNSVAETDEAGMRPWIIKGADPNKYPVLDEESLDETWGDSKYGPNE